jgi:hypothetical protein
MRPIFVLSRGDFKRGAVNENSVSLLLLSFGMKLCDELDEARIQKIVLVLLVVSGFALTLPRS